MENSTVFFRLSDARTEMMRFSVLTHDKNSSVFSYVAPSQIQDFAEPQNLRTAKG